MSYESVIGIEIHAQLKTNTKLFCGSSTTFGCEPNTNICPVCLGLPGALPVLNEAAVDLAIRAGIAVGCEIQHKSVFARKNYFYPDLPKGYQISQFDLPICLGGSVTVDVNGEPKTIGVTRIHMEEDAGKLVHQGADAIAGADSSIVDLNRAGVALIEIVSEPDIRSAAEARAYMEYIKLALEYADVCDGNLEQGSLRADANVSVRKIGETTFGTRTETKNLNSFRSIERAINYEIDRQIKLIESGGKVEQQTRHFDDATGKTIALRSKADAHDYRYFPDPDLKPLVLKEERIKHIEKSMPELPAVKKMRYIETYNLSETDTNILLQDRGINTFFEETIHSESSINPKEVAKWVLGTISAMINAHSGQTESLNLQPKHVAKMIRLIDTGKISKKMGKELLDEMAKTGDDPEKLVDKKGGGQIDNQDELIGIVESILDNNLDVVEKVKGGKTKSADFLMGQVMKQTKGRAKPDLVRQMILECINKR